MSIVAKDTVLAFQQAASVRPVGDGAVILLADSGQLYTGNATTEAILRRIDGELPVGELAVALCDEFDIGIEAATADVIEIAERLIDEGVLRVVE